MRIFVKAKPASKKEEVRRIDGTHFEVSVKEPPREGRANKAILKALAEYLGVSFSRLEIVSGFGSRTKILELVDEN